MPDQTPAESLSDEALTILHDLRSPIALILRNVEFLEGHASDPERAEALQDIRWGAAHALRIVENLLTLANVESGRPQPRPTPTCVATLLHDVVRRRRREAEERAIDLSLELGGAWTVELDPELMVRVLDNLLDNAFRHTPRGGRIAVRAAEGAQSVQIAIGNSGGAIPPEQRGALFERHRRSGAGSYANLGLGLYFCRAAVEAQGGRIRFEESELPVVFVIEFPR
jgi:signal transduction histidine kinase